MRSGYEGANPVDAADESAFDGLTADAGEHHPLLAMIQQLLPVVLGVDVFLESCTFPSPSLTRRTSTSISSPSRASSASTTSGSEENSLRGMMPSDCILY
jgi:hypothetical protein